MKTAVAAAICAAALLSSCRAREGDAPGDGIRWMDSIPAALKEAARRRGPVMAVLYSDRSSWCRRLDAETFADPEVRSLARRFVAARVDVDGDRETRSAYAPSALPTVLFMDAEGKVVRRAVGFKPAPGFLAEMRAALDQAR
jgi:thioredoxin-related protein